MKTPIISRSSLSDLLYPIPQNIHETSIEFTPPPSVSLKSFDSLPLHDIAAQTGLQTENDAYPVSIRESSESYREGWYRLEITESESIITAGDSLGIRYALDTLKQLLFCAKSRGTCRQLVVEDYPAYARRDAMVDMGRSVFNLARLKRMVRLFAKLRYTHMHLRLWDDELCGVTFDGLKLGCDNPYALSLAELCELEAYARSYDIELMPELPSWGHVGALVYHYPHLRGGPGMFEGASFLIGRQSIDFYRELLHQIAQTLPKIRNIHMGFDEAVWYQDTTLSSEFNPEKLLRTYIDMTDEMFGRDNCKVHIYADHAGRELSDDLAGKVILQPWEYWYRNRDKIETKINKYSNGCFPWMMVVGRSRSQYRGAYKATRYFAQNAVDIENCVGLTVSMWGTNNLIEDLWPYFLGASYAWNPHAETMINDESDPEVFDWKVYPEFIKWMSATPDSWPENFQKDMLPSIYMGYYWLGEKHGQCVSPSAKIAKTLAGHDFINESLSAVL